MVIDQLNIINTFKNIICILKFVYSFGIWFGFSFFYSRNIESVRLFMKFNLVSVMSLYVTVKIKFGIIDFYLTKFDCT